MTVWVKSSLCGRDRDKVWEARSDPTRPDRGLLASMYLQATGGLDKTSSGEAEKAEVPGQRSDYSALTSTATSIRHSKVQEVSREGANKGQWIHPLPPGVRPMTLAAWRYNLPRLTTYSVTLQGPQDSKRGEVGILSEVKCLNACTFSFLSCI